jgi:carboxyl-terminal processing protease
MSGFRRFVVLVALIFAWAFSGNDRIPLTLSVSQQAAAAPPNSAKAPYELSALRVMTRVVNHVKDEYVDPRRVKPKEMFIAALEAVEKSTADVMVDGTVESGTVKVNVNGKMKDFDISGIDTLWKMTANLKEMFDFIAKNMRPVEEAKEIEYAAINGMLQTLDPHTVLLKPEFNREMKLSTKGEFGGLGFVIQMKEGMLTVVKVLPKTPASRAGIKKDDQVQKIGEESTVNLDLNDAVSKLRGPVDTKVTIAVFRKGWEKPQVMSVTRALITIESVQSKLLAQNVGYVRLKNFQGNTTRDLEAALNDMTEVAKKSGAQGLKGLVLDMRGNPGGLLEQAVQVSDTFLSSGTIVATVGLSDRLREEKRAHPDESDDAFPMVVLVNAGSASASEIVAGALKNLNRAVIIGRQSFGKGSVQVLNDIEDSALKITIAKYLTPGDVSIQEIGITPDIELQPTRISKERIDIFAPRRVMGEADLEHHFGNPSNAEAVKKRDDVVMREKPSESLRYLKDEKPPKPEVKKPVAKKGDKDVLTDAETPPEELDDQMDAEAQDEIKEDFEVTFAREFLLAAPKLRRDEMMKAGRSFVQEKRKGEDKRISEALTGLGVDWSAAPLAKNLKGLTATLKPATDKKIVAGETVPLDLTVENKGTETVSRLRGWIEVENYVLDRREFVFGLVKPGEKKTWGITAKVPKDFASRRDAITVKLQDDAGNTAEAQAGELNFVELPKPQFAFTWSVNDTCEACNGDGLIQKGESVTLFVDVTNVGSGKAPDAFSSIRNASGEEIFIEKGRFKLGELSPGETKSARFQLQVKPGFVLPEFGVKFAVIDEALEEFTADKLVIPVSPTGPNLAWEAKKQLVKISEKSEIFASADASRALAKLTSGGIFEAVAKGANVTKIQWEPGRTVYVKNTDVRESKGGKLSAPKDMVYLPSRKPAEIALNIDSSTGGSVVDGEKFTLSGVVIDPALLDVLVMVNDQKVFFKGHEKSSGPQEKFSTEFLLKQGNNIITVVARQSSDFATRKSVIVRRRAPAVAQKEAAINHR